MILPALLVSALLSFSAGARLATPAAEPAKSVAAKPRAQERIIWTNEVVAHWPGALTPFEPALSPAPEAPAEAAAAPTFTYIHERDPEWYRDQLAPLEFQLTMIGRKMAEIRTALSDPLRYGSAAVPLGEAAAGRPRLSPENELAMLEQERTAVQAEINRLHDLARRNWLPPGAAR